jgi:hypothetical protein
MAQCNGVSPTGGEHKETKKKMIHNEARREEGGREEGGRKKEEVFFTLNNLRTSLERCQVFRNKLYK